VIETVTIESSASARKLASGQTTRKQFCDIFILECLQKSEKLIDSIKEQS